MATLLAKTLAEYHYLVNVTHDGKTGLDLAKTYGYDLLILDAIVPGLDGIKICRQLRCEGYEIPILMLTAKASNRDRVQALEVGADDYVVKPFYLPELMARIRALLRRGRAIAPRILIWDHLQLNLDTQEVHYRSHPIRLTPKEYGLLELFLRHPYRIFSRSALLDRVWPLGEFPGEEAVRTQIMGLRQKLKSAGMTADLIETVYGLGYRLKPPPIPATSEKPNQTVKEPSETVDASLPSSSASESLSPVEAEIAHRLEQMWETLKDRLKAQIDLLHQAVAHLCGGTLTDTLRQQAKTEAHRLIGSLGSFGIVGGSEIARELEQLLEETDSPSDRARKALAELVPALQQAIKQPRTLEQPENQPKPTSLSLNPPPNCPPIKLLVVDDDPLLIKQIQLAALKWGWQVEGATNFTAAQEALNCHPPNVVLLDLTFPATPEDGLTFLETLNCHYSSIPAVVMTGRNSLTDRIAVARLGGRAYLQKPIAPEQLRHTIIQALNCDRSDETKILMVDDDPVILATLPALLEPWGLQTTTLNDPQQFWEVLEASAPDLLLLDIEMPGFSGLELCSAVRNDPRWGGIPILFLSAHTDIETICKVFAAGADDYASKPIVEPELIARILNRAERRQLIKKLTSNLG